MQCKAKQAQVPPAKLTGKASRQSKDAKKDQRPVKPDWLLNHTPPKPDAMIQFPPEMDENWLRYELLN